MSLPRPPDPTTPSSSSLRMTDKDWVHARSGQGHSRHARRPQVTAIWKNNLQPPHPCSTFCFLHNDLARTLTHNFCCFSRFHIVLPLISSSISPAEDRLASFFQLFLHQLSYEIGLSCGSESNPLSPV